MRLTMSDEMVCNEGPPAKSRKIRHICDLGTREVVEIISFVSKPDKVEEFELSIQGIGHCLHKMKNGISDVRVAHPKVGEVNFVITFLTRADADKFSAESGPACCMFSKLCPLVVDSKPRFRSAGTLMPCLHTLCSLLEHLKRNLRGKRHSEHDVPALKKELGKWFPRKCEYEKYIHWDEANPHKYTRNVIFSNEFMDVLLMCWPAKQKSSIHDHDDSSCFAMVVEGDLEEVQYAMPPHDKNFIESEMKNPTGAVGRCGELREIGRTKMRQGQVQYANNELALHRIENNTDTPAFSLHVYAPGLLKMRIYKESGHVTVATVPTMSQRGARTGEWRKDTHPDGVIDVAAWNAV